MLANHVKQRIKSGKPCFGSLLNFGDPLVAEMMAAVGFEWLLVDGEHGPIDLATMATMFATITRYPVAPLVRVHALSEENVKRVLDAGAWGVLAPNVRTRAEAELLVAACNYPPKGVRSLGAGRFALSFKTRSQENTPQLQSHTKLSYPLFFFLMTRRPPRSPLFPYTTLFRSAGGRLQLPAEGRAEPRRRALRALVQDQIAREHASTPVTHKTLISPFFFFNDTATPEISPLPLHDALPICWWPPATTRRRACGASAPGASRSRSRPDRKRTRLNSSHTQNSHIPFFFF